MESLWLLTCILVEMPKNCRLARIIDAGDWPHWASEKGNAGEIYHLWAASGKWTEVGCSPKGQGTLLSKKRCLQTELVKEWAKVSRQAKGSSQGDMCNASLHQERRNWTTAEMVVRHFSWGQKMFHLKYGSRDEEGIERMVIWKKNGKIDVN